MENMVKTQVPENILTRAVEVPLTVGVMKTVKIQRAVEFIPFTMGESQCVRQSANTKSISLES